MFLPLAENVSIPLFFYADDWYHNSARQCICCCMMHPSGNVSSPVLSRWFCEIPVCSVSSMTMSFLKKAYKIGEKGLDMEFAPCASIRISEARNREMGIVIKDMQWEESA